MPIIREPERLKSMNYDLRHNSVPGQTERERFSHAARMHEKFLEGVHLRNLDEVSFYKTHRGEN